MNKMGIKINMSAFFNDERQMVYIMVDPSWECVENLQKRVEYLFEVNLVRFKDQGGYYLSPKDSIEIVQFCEELKAFAPKELLEKRKKKKSKKSKSVEKPTQESSGSEESLIKTKDMQELDHVKKMRKYNSLDITHLLAKRVKSFNTDNESLKPIQHDNKCMEITSTSEQTHSAAEQTQETVKAGSSKKSKTKHSKNCEVNDAVTDYQSNSSVVKQNITSPEKRNELMKTETGSGEENMFLNNTQSMARSTSIPSSTFLNESKVLSHQKHSKKNSSNFNNPLRKTLSKNSHIYFNENGERISTTNKSQSKSDKESETNIIFRCVLQDVKSSEAAKTPRIFSFERKCPSSKKEKNFIEITETIILSPIPRLFFENKSLGVNKETTSTSLAKEHNNSTINLEQEKNNTNISEKGTAEDLTKENTVSSETATVTDNTNISNNIDNVTEKTVVKPETENNDKDTEPADNKSASESVDCVDLSMELEESDITTTKSETANAKHDTTSDKNAIDSSSDVEEISEIIDLNETEDYSNSTFSNSPAVSRSLKSDIEAHKILPFCTNMLDLPQINDIMVFKMPYANWKQKSDETSYLAGKVEYINRRTKCIKIMLLDGLTEINHIDARFVLNWRDSDNFVVYLQVKMSDMIEPKLYKRK